MRMYEQEMTVIIQSKGYNTRLRNMNNNNGLNKLVKNCNVNEVKCFVTIIRGNRCTKINELIS